MKLQVRKGRTEHSVKCCSEFGHAKTRKLLTELYVQGHFRRQGRSGNTETLKLAKVGLAKVGQIRMAKVGQNFLAKVGFGQSRPIRRPKSVWPKLASARVTRQVRKD